MSCPRVNLVIAAAAASLVWGTVASAAQPPAEWVRHYNGPSYLADAVEYMALGPGGTITVVGASDGLNGREDIATIRYDTAGNELWVARYNGVRNWIDVPAGVGVDAAGATYVLGSEWGGLNNVGGTEWDYVLIKYNPNGSQAWVRRYDGPLHWSDSPTAIAVDPAGNAYVGGYAVKERDQYNRLMTHLHVAKFDTQGNLEWEVFYDLVPHFGAGTDDLRIAPDGNIVATGEAAVPLGGGTQDDIITLKISPAGQILWVRQWDSGGFNNSLDDAKRVRTDRFDNVYVLAQHMSDDLDRHLDGTLIRYSPAGALEWTAVMNLDNPDGFFELIDDADGNLYLSGGWDNRTDLDGMVVSFDPNGQERWRRFFDGLAGFDYQFANTIMRGPDGLLYVGLDYQWDDPAGYDYTIAVMDNDGNELDLWRYDTGSTSDTFPWIDGYLMDAAGNIFIGGYSWFELTLADFTTVKVPTQGGGLPGDINGDGVVNYDDVEPFVRVLIGMPLAPEHVARSDLNGDGAANGSDTQTFLGLLLSP